MPSKELSEIFHAGESPYFGMYTAGRVGYGLEETVSYVRQLGIPLREKDVKAWEDGNFKREMYFSNRKTSRLNPVSSTPSQHTAPTEMPSFSELPLLPEGWKGTDRRFFPCTPDNRPMRKWGWSDSFTPDLLLRIDAELLSPCKWVGQNMLYQPFIVLDIDGVGHGCVDEPVIQFGSLFKDKTLTFEDPAKPGSFHLYMRTNRLIPVKHFPWAKLDLMGNAVNAAVYFKNKKPNGLEPIELTEDIWYAIDTYQKKRKEAAHVAEPNR